MLQDALLVVEQVPQDAVDRAHGHRHVARRRTVLLGQPADALADLSLRLRSVLLELGEALGRVDAAFKMARPSRWKIELSAHGTSSGVGRRATASRPPRCLGGD